MPREWVKEVWQKQGREDPWFVVHTGEDTVPSPPPSISTEQQGWPLLSSLLPLHCIPSSCSVIKTTGGTRNTACLLPACNRHHLVQRRGFFPPSKQPGVKTSKARLWSDLSGVESRGNNIHCLSNLSATQSVKWERELELVSHQVSYLPFLQGPFASPIPSFLVSCPPKMSACKPVERVFSKESCSADYFCFGACLAKANMLTTPWNMAEVMRKHALSRSQHITELWIWSEYKISMKSLVYLYILFVFLSCL